MHINANRRQDNSCRQTDTLLFHAEHLFLVFPHQRHCLLELLNADILF